MARARVIVLNSALGPLDYRVPQGMSVAPGSIVVAPLGVTWYLLGLHDPVSYNISTNVIGIGLAMVFRFWAYRTWVFPDRGEQDPAAEVVVTDGFDRTSR